VDQGKIYRQGEPRRTYEAPRLGEDSQVLSDMEEARRRELYLKRFVGGEEASRPAKADENIK